MLLADCRDTMTEAVGALHSQGADILQALQTLPTPVVAPAPRWPWWFHGVGGVLAGALLVGVCWWGWPVGREHALIGALDATLVQAYPQLPKLVQDSLTAVYRQHGFQGPAGRTKGGK
jgi:hypothetical protein